MSISKQDIKTAKEIARSQNLYRYVDEKCLERYNGINGAKIEEVEALDVKGHGNGLEQGVGAHTR